jgi:aminomuconate-semialdehyde/2-hydroxymuconate-6-semialdehyde dehydrogenase
MSLAQRSKTKTETEARTKIPNLVGGALQPPVSGNWLENVNPATGEVYSLVPDSDASDVDAAVEAARSAFPAWSGMTAAERARILNRIADLVERDRERLVEAETNDNGKPLRLSRTVDIPRVSTNLRFFAAMAESFASESHAAPGTIHYTRRDPLGVVACISPWNLPLYLMTWKIAPALATGNCVIAKPSEVTPMTASLFAELSIEAGLPAGVLNIVHGTGATTGNAILLHPRIQAISFTGGTATGEHIARTVAPLFRKLSLELGGKNPNVIFADCDYERMMQSTLLSSFSNQGQICLCGSRVLVERPLYERFVEDLVIRARKLRVGDPLDDANDLGAVVSQPHQRKILACVDTAKREGGHLHCGGEPAEVNGRCAGGYFVQPTVFTGLGPEARTNQEEIFGPVVTVQPFDDEEEALRLANDSRYGLSATVWTENLGRAHRMAEGIESGVVWINCWLVRDLRTPFGGMKSSGLGREGGLESLRFFTEPKNVCVKYR